MLYAVGLTEEDMHKPQIGIASLWWEGLQSFSLPPDLDAHLQLRQSMQCPSP